jgi:hypothetical protein
MTERDFVAALKRKVELELVRFVGEWKRENKMKLPDAYGENIDEALSDFGFFLFQDDPR